MRIWQVTSYKINPSSTCILECGTPSWACFINFLILFYFILFSYILFSLFYSFSLVFFLLNDFIIQYSSSFLIYCDITQTGNGVTDIWILPFIFLSCSQTIGELGCSFFVWNNYFIAKLSQKPQLAELYLYTLFHPRAPR